MKIILSFLFLTFQSLTYSQTTFNKFLTASDSFNKKKCIIASSFSAVSYSVFSIGLYSAWYKKNNLEKFHTFNDWGEWKYMDKCGHVYSSYIQTTLVFQGAKWVGMKRNSSEIWALGLSNLFQSTIEIFDGFSPKWGFSWTDIGANVLGNAFFIAQEKIWQEQKILLKFSSHPIHYSPEPNFIYSRTQNIYGTSILEKLLKDYNGQTYWLSFNPSIFSNNANSIWPKYINLSLGYGAQGMYGGKSNVWLNSENEMVRLSGKDFPRYNQYYLSLDLDLRKIKVKNKFLKTIFTVVNIFKIPSPTLEYNSLGKTKFHWFMF